MSTMKTYMHSSREVIATIHGDTLIKHTLYLRLAGGIHIHASRQQQYFDPFSRQLLLDRSDASTLKQERGRPSSCCDRGGVKPGRQKALPALGDLGLDLIHHSRLGEGAQIAELIALTRDDLAHNAAHDLARARLGQVIDDIYLLGRREGADDLANLECKLLG